MQKGELFVDDMGPFAHATDRAFFDSHPDALVRVQSTDRAAPAHVVCDFGDVVEIRIAIRPHRGERVTAVQFYAPVKALYKFGMLTNGELRNCAMFPLSRAKRFGGVAAFTAEELQQMSRA